MMKDLKKIINEDFLNTLIEVAKQYGWKGGDYSEIEDFVEWCFEKSGKENKESLRPYEYEDFEQ